MPELDGQLAAVTGASSGLGRAPAHLVVTEAVVAPIGERGWP